MNKSTDLKFQACTSYSLDDLKGIIKKRIYRNYFPKFIIEEFRDSLKEHEMEEYTEHLYYYMILARQKFEKFPVQFNKSLTISKQQLKFQKELVLLLKELLTGGKLESTLINITEPKKIRSERLVNILHSSAITSLSKAIKDEGLNMYPLKKEEAIDAINSQTDIQWVKKWMESMGYIDPDYENFTLDRFDDYFSKLDLSPVLPELKEKLRDELISEYAYDHSQEADLDIKELDQILQRIKKTKSKRGRKEYTIDEKYLAHTLSALVRVERYLQNPDMKSIQKVNIENSDCRFIHDVMAFFGLIFDYRKTKKKKKPENTIRKKLNTFTDQATIEDTDEKLQILKSKLSLQQ